MDQTPLNYSEVEEQLRAGYRLATAQYRRDDEIEVTTENHRRLCQILERICHSFPHPIQVLEVGCGTGRNFHCLENAAGLVGIDISDDMLAAAKTPVCQESISVPRIELLRCNAYLACFPPGSFHFIFSLGMFGYGCPVTPELCGKFHDWLAPGGKLLFNIVDLAGVDWHRRVRRRLRLLVYPWLPKRIQQALDERAKCSPFFGLTKRQLRKVLAATPFAEFTITSHPCHSPLWKGRHLECLALKHA